MFKSIFSKLQSTTASLGPETAKQIDELIYTHVNKLVSNDPSKRIEIVSALSPSVRNIFAIRLLEEQIHNGGYFQFLWNSSRDYMDFALDGLIMVGARKQQYLLDKAIKKCMSEMKDMEMKSLWKEHTLEAFSKAIKKSILPNIDQEFFSVEKNENILQLRLKYIQLHKNEFTKIGDV